MLLEPGEERRVAEQPVFHDLGVAGAELARRKRGKRAGVGEHEARLMEGADQVLALLGVDAGLAADRGIDLGKQAGRNLHEAHAAPQNARGEAREVADHTAAERDHAIAALHAEIEQRLAKPREHRKALALLAGRDHRIAEKDASRLQALLKRREIERRDIGIAHHGAARAGQRASAIALARRRDQAIADKTG